jgi:hypothetical protein
MEEEGVGGHKLVEEEVEELLEKVDAVYSAYCETSKLIHMPRVTARTKR